jgi:methionyl-tRNA formyltransferase
MVALRLVFFGTPPFAATALGQLLASRHHVAGVVTQPDRPRGRGQRAAFSAVKEVAVQAGLPVLQPERLKAPDFQDSLRTFDADLGVVAAYGRIIPDDVLHIAPLGMINIHASILPKYRGAAPVHRAIIAGERETGVSIMRVVRELDAGPVFAIDRVPIGPDDTSPQVEQLLAARGARLCVKVTDEIADGTATETPQDHTQATYAPRLTKDEGWLDWSRPARELHNLVRGLQPWPLAQSMLNGERLSILSSVPLPDGRERQPGEIVKASGDDLVVASGDGALQLRVIKPEARRVMTAREFLAGRRVPVGSHFESLPPVAP